MFRQLRFCVDYVCGTPRVVCDVMSDKQGLPVGGGEAVVGQQPVPLVYTGDIPA